MRLTFVLGIIYLAILRWTHPAHRVHTPRVEDAGIVWGSIAPRNSGEPV